MLAGYTVLMLVDDSPLYRKLGWVLEHKGCKVLQAGHETHQAEAIYLRQFDLIMAQVSKGGGEEVAALKQVKRLHPQAKLVLCSRDGEMVFPLEAYQLEVDDYLLMPCRLAELWRRVAACLQRAPGNAGDAAAVSWLGPINGAILEKFKRIFHYLRYHLDAAATALQPLINAGEARPDEKMMAKIHEVSARLEVLQEMADGFLGGFPGWKRLPVQYLKGSMDGYPSAMVNRI